MKRTVKSLKGFSMGATDGEIGHVSEFYFDDQFWTIRYVIIDTGNWLFGRKVLIAPQAITHPEWEQKIFGVNLTKEQVKNSPEINTEKPVSRQQEIELHSHYPWGSYWGGGLWAGGLGVTGMMMSTSLPIEEAIQKEAGVHQTKEANDPHLRSTGNITGYTLKAVDGDIGEIEDFILNDATWEIAWLVIDTGKWFPGKKVIISPKWIKEINWATSEVVISATMEQVKDSPEYEPGKEISDEDEARLQNHYGIINAHQQSSSL